MCKEAFLLEIGTEEIPARFMAPALKQMQESAQKELQSLRFDYGNITTFGTPRRLALLISDLSDRQQDLSEKKKGPAAKAAFDAEGTPTKAAEGFARSQGVAVADLYLEELDGVRYVFANRQETGRETLTLLPEFCVRLIKSLAFPKPMFWYSKDIRFARPVRWLAAVFGSKKVTFEFAGLLSSNMTYGHRFLAPEGVVIDNAADYLEIMRNNSVVADPSERERQIIALVEEAAGQLGGHSTFEADLLEEVVSLVEFPAAVTGSFATDYLETPPEVLITAMRAHQRYFPVFNAAGKLLPHFITISNGTKEEFTANVRAGNERVLRARLADARFFFDEDRKKPFAAFTDELAKIVFMEPLGSMLEKTRRLVQLAEKLADQLALGREAKAAAARAAYLAKADLMTHMVYEFPELQGTMGMHYALLSNETQEVAKAVGEHYAPRFAGDAPAETLPGAVVALADKMDTLGACFSLGLIPTGSQDPYALRRTAAGVIATLITHKLSVPLNLLCNLALAGLRDSLPDLQPATASHMEEFLLQRVRYSFSDQGIRYDVIDAVLAGAACSVPELMARAQVLQEKLGSPELTMLLTPYTRAANLTRDVQKTLVDTKLFVSGSEQKLYAAVLSADSSSKAAAQAGDYEQVFTALAPLSEPISAFFEEVMVMVDDPAIRSNRLALLLMVKELFQTFGDISKIVQEKI